MKSTRMVFAAFLLGVVATAVFATDVEPPTAKHVENPEVVDTVAEADGKPEWCKEATWSLYILECKSRRSAGLKAKRLSRSLCRACDRRAVEIRSRWGHANWQAYARQEGYQGSTAEIIAKHSSATPSNIHIMWMNSGGHRAQLLGSHRDVGFSLINGHGVGISGTPGANRSVNTSNGSGSRHRRRRRR